MTSESSTPSPSPAEAEHTAAGNYFVANYPPFSFWQREQCDRVAQRLQQRDELGVFAARLFERLALIGGDNPNLGVGVLGREGVDQPHFLLLGVLDVQHAVDVRHVVGVGAEALGGSEGLDVYAEDLAVDREVEYRS